MAVGVMATGFAFSGLLIPVVTKMIDAIDWRQTLFILGIVGIVLCAPLALLVRHKPEDYGCVPDGTPLQAAGQNNTSASVRPKPDVPEIEVTTVQALKSRTFWHIVTAYTLQFAIIGAMLAHVVPFLGSIGISRSTASFFAAAIPIISIIGRLGSGWLSDKFSRKRVAVAAFGILCVGTFLFDYVNNTLVWLLVVAVVLYSVSYGSANTLRAVLMREYFGRKHYGTIFGFLIGIMSVGTIVGPYVAGWIYDTWQSYHYAWWLFTVLNVAALVLILTTPRLKVKAKAEEAVKAATSP
jgi:MFS family permease